MNQENSPMPGALRHLEERLVELREEAETLLGTLERTTGEVETELAARMRERPYGVLAAAAAVGYVLGGGLPSRLTRLAFAIGGRIGIEYVWRELSARLVASAGAVPVRTENSPPGA